MADKYRRFQVGKLSRAFWSLSLTASDGQNPLVSCSIRLYYAVYAVHYVVSTMRPCHDTACCIPFGVAHKRDGRTDVIWQRQHFQYHAMVEKYNLRRKRLIYRERFDGSPCPQALLASFEYWPQQRAACVFMFICDKIIMLLLSLEKHGSSR
jgi:hypothetical protein